MSAEVDSMAFVGATPWHGLGVQVEDSITSADAITAAGLDWRVGKRALTYYSSPGNMQTVSDHVAIVNENTGKAIGVVGNRYQPVQNHEAFSWFDKFISAEQCRFHTAGSLSGGRKVWILAKLNRSPSVIVPGDEVEKFLLLSNSHDGLSSIKVGFTPIRVVCSNTLSLAHNDQASSLLRVYHCGNPLSTLEKIQDTVDAINARFESTAEQYRDLASRQCNTADLEKYVEIVFGVKPAEEREKKSSTLSRITELFEDGKGQNIPGTRGTWWAAYNATTEYLNFRSGRSASSRLNSLWFASNKVRSQQALQQALVLSA